MSDTVVKDQAAPSLLIRRAELPGRGLFDLRVRADRIASLDTHLEPVSGDRVIEARGGALLPGLHDHHLHLFATAAARGSLRCGPPDVNDERSLCAALEQRCAQGTGWIRGIGFYDSVCPRLDRYWLDRACPDRPVRIQHRSGMLWVLNSCALERLQLSCAEELPPGVERDADGNLTGCFYDLDAWLGEHLERAWPSLRGLSAELARFGITGVTDTGARNGRAAWRALSRASERGELLQRLLVMGSDALQDIVPDRPERTGVGPLKIYLREIDLPDFDALVRRMATAHEHARPVAIHCVTRVELHFALAALTEAGSLPGDRVEHASVADDHAMEKLAVLGVTVVTQPHFIAERGDQYLVDVEAGDVPLLYRGGGFLRAGITLAAGSDAPYGSTDPWAAMRAAVGRCTRAGVLMDGDERLTPRQALALFGGDLRQPGGRLRELAVGQAADLCLLDVPFDELCAGLDARHVAMTLCDGQIAYAAERHTTDAVGDHLSNV